MSAVHLFYCPFTGLGLYGGFRGNRWLKNRLQIFKQFVLPSLRNQTKKDFILWISWRPEERNNSIVQEFIGSLKEPFKIVHTFHGVCFWDDKYPDPEARNRLMTSLQYSLMELVNYIGDADDVYMTIQPSDDLYSAGMVEGTERVFQQISINAFGFTMGYMFNPATMELAEYNPNTNPPFFTIKFSKAIFIDPLKHAQYTGPYKSHEYVPQYLKYVGLAKREFVVSTHGENISTVWNHPFRGRLIEGEEKQALFAKFGITGGPLKISFSWRKRLLRRLPHRIQRKLRYIFGEKLWQKVYEFLRN